MSVFFNTILSQSPVVSTECDFPPFSPHPPDLHGSAEILAIFYSVWTSANNLTGINGQNAGIENILWYSIRRTDRPDQSPENSAADWRVMKCFTRNILISSCLPPPSSQCGCGDFTNGAQLVSGEEAGRTGGLTPHLSPPLHNIRVVLSF